MTSPAFELRNIGKSFPGVTALEGVSLAVRPGGAHALIGENGAGKSTLLKILSANERADVGDILIDGREVILTDPRSAREAGIAMIHQELQLVPHMTVAQNLFLGAVPTRFGLTDHRTMFRRARDVLAGMNSTIDVRATVHNLSVADKQMVEIARAFLWNARIIAMDEPTSALTEKEFESLEILIRQLRAKGTAIVYVSHKLDEVSRVCETGTVLRDGHVIDTIQLAEHTQASIISLMVGRKLDFSKSATRTAGPTLLEAKKLSSRHRVRNVSVDVRRGEVLGIAGLVGAGRTEFVRLLAGVDRPDAGDLILNGKKVRFRTRSAAARMRIGLVPEDRKKEALIPARSIAANVALPVFARFAPIGLLDRRTLGRKVNEMLKNVALRPMQPHREIKKFSGGNQQKAIIARWLLADCDLFILDEPTRGIDVRAKQEVYDLIDALAAEGKAVVVVSSELPEVIRLSDRVLVMREGTASGLLAAEEISESSILALAMPTGAGKSVHGR
jgi:ribose transport system ATP-binding protein